MEALSLLFGLAGLLILGWSTIGIVTPRPLRFQDRWAAAAVMAGALMLIAVSSDILAEGPNAGEGPLAPGMIGLILIVAIPIIVTRMIRMANAHEKGRDIGRGRLQTIARNIVAAQTNPLAAAKTPAAIEPTQEAAPVIVYRTLDTWRERQRADDLARENARLKDALADLNRWRENALGESAGRGAGNRRSSSSRNRKYVDDFDLDEDEEIDFAEIASDARWKPGQRGRRASFTYVDAHGEVTERSVTNWESDWAYIKGHCEMRNDHRTFRKDRIEDWRSGRSARR